MDHLNLPTFFFPSFFSSFFLSFFFRRDSTTLIRACSPTLYFQEFIILILILFLFFFVIHSLFSIFFFLFILMASLVQPVSLSATGRRSIASLPLRLSSSQFAISPKANYTISTLCPQSKLSPIRKFFFFFFFFKAAFSKSLKNMKEGKMKRKNP